MKSILIIDDDPLMQGFYNILLNKTGLSAVIEENSDTVFELIKCNRVSLILLDINLRNTYFEGRKINGIQLGRYIKKNISADIPILMVSADDAILWNEEFNLFADDFVPKPIPDVNLFIQKIKFLMIENDKA